LDSNFEAHKVAEEARERHERLERGGGESHGARWVPIAASILAVIAALANLVSNQRSAAALIAKNEAILAQAKATDAYNFYESRRIRQRLYEALVDSGVATDPARVTKLRKTAADEIVKEKPILKQAQDSEHAVDVANERSEHALKAHEILEIAVTFFEIAIVLVSISALVTTPLLSGVAIAAATGGLIVFVVGFFSH
jgi:hypothetical protein